MTIAQLEELADLPGLSTEAKECKLKKDLFKLLIDHCFEGDADDLNKNAALEACIKPKAERPAAVDEHLANLVLGHLNDCPDNKDAAKECLKEHTTKRSEGDKGKSISQGKTKGQSQSQR